MDFHVCCIRIDLELLCTPSKPRNYRFHLNYGEGFFLFSRKKKGIHLINHYIEMDNKQTLTHRQKVNVVLTSCELQERPASNSFN